MREVTLIGGEAYLRDDWLDLVRAVRSHGMQCSTTTGARGITGEIARAAKAAGLQSASVSVDGLRPTHDHIRALDGSFDAAMRGLRAFRAAGIPVSANTHINRLNLREIPEVFELLVAEGASVGVFYGGPSFEDARPPVTQQKDAGDEAGSVVAFYGAPAMSVDGDAAPDGASDASSDATDRG